MAKLLEIPNGRKILFLMATTHECDENLRKICEPEFIGVGPVEAAVNTTQVLSQLNQYRQMPDLVVNMGSAGSNTLTQTEVYQVSHVSYRDMDASALGFEKGCTPFLELLAELEMPYQIPDLPSAKLSTGANIVSGSDYDSISADMVDMETFAVLRACQKFSVSLIGLRGISDGREEVEKFEDWTRYLAIVDKNLAFAVGKLIAAISNDSLEL